jgi:chromate transporter
VTDPDPSADAPLRVVLREWGRLGCIGFGGPPTHIRLLRELCVDRHGWMGAEEFEDAVAACNMLPGPASTQLAIYCASRVAGRRGALVGGAAFILPGLVVILGLTAVLLGHPPTWVLAAGAGAGSAVAAVAVHAAGGLVPASWERARSRWRWALYVLATALVAVLVGPWVVLALVGCGLCELVVRHPPSSGPTARGRDGTTGTHALVPALALWSGRIAGAGTATTLAWTAFKVGALSYGGGFVIIPLMQSDAVDRYHWMSAGEFLNAVALGQITPGPVVQTVASVGYAAAGLGGGLLAAVVAFSPSFLFVLLGADHFDALRGNARVRAFLDGSGPAAIGAITGTAFLLAASLDETWRFAVLAGSAAMLLAWRRGVVVTLLAAATAGVILVAGGAHLP